MLLEELVTGDGVLDSSSMALAAAVTTSAVLNESVDIKTALRAENGGPDEPVSAAQLYFVICFLSFLAVVGTTGNAIVLYVFCMKKDKLTSTVFIIALATVDFVTCLVVIPFTVYMEYVDFYVSSDIVCKLYQFLITSNIPFSALIMVAIAVDRYLCICHPFLHLMTVGRAKVLNTCLALVAVSLGGCVSTFFGVFRRVPLQEPLIANRSSSPLMYDDYDATAATSGSDIEIPSTSTSGVDGSDHVGMGVGELVNIGHCEPNDLLVSLDLQWYYQKFYTFMYPGCLVVVVVLYILIYRSVLHRRALRQQQKSKSLNLVLSAKSTASAEPTTATRVCAASDTDDKSRLTVTTTSMTSHDISGNQTPPSTLLKPPIADGSLSAEYTTCSATDKSKPGGDCQTRSLMTGVNKKAKPKGRKKVCQGGGSIASGSSSSASSKVDSNWLANLKTAGMLFVVTVVFVVTYMPAFFMAMLLVPYNIIVFYLYFANNVANPVIYSFMNQNFRTDLKRIFCPNRG